MARIDSRRPHPHPAAPPRRSALDARALRELRYTSAMAVSLRRIAGDDDAAIRTDTIAAAAEAVAAEYPSDPWTQEAFVGEVRAAVDSALSTPHAHP